MRIQLAAIVRPLLRRFETWAPDRLAEQGTAILEWHMVQDGGGPNVHTSGRYVIVDPSGVSVTVATVDPEVVNATLGGS